MLKDLLNRPYTWAAGLGRNGTRAITEHEVVRVEGYHLAGNSSVIQGRLNVEIKGCERFGEARDVNVEMERCGGRGSVRRPGGREKELNASVG